MSNVSLKAPNISRGKYLYSFEISLISKLHNDETNNIKTLKNNLLDRLNFVCLGHKNIGSSKRKHQNKFFLCLKYFDVSTPTQI
jgi:hypothetical protein